MVGSRTHTLGGVRSDSRKHGCLVSVAVSKSLLKSNQVLNINALILIHYHFSLGHVVSLEVFAHFTGPDHLRLDIDDSLHDLLILTVYSLSLALLGDVI